MPPGSNSARPGIDFLRTRHPQGSGATAAPGEFRNGVKGFGGRTGAADELVEGHRPDVLGAGQRQPVPALTRVELGDHVEPGSAAFFFAPIFGSSPFTRRRMLASWRMQISTAMKAASAAMIDRPISSA